MQAVVIHAPRDLRLEEAEVPPLQPGQVEVRVRRGGICGSDLHYYLHGGFGAVRVREPMILGHEVAGEIAAIGPGVTGLAPGMAVAVHPALPCGTCRFCRAGQSTHCLDMRYFGSAMRTPHVQGAFRERLVCAASQAVPLPAGLSLEMAAFAEPLSVALHAVHEAGPLLGARVLVTGAGPIGALVMMAARLAGAREVVATDILAAPLAMALKIGADAARNTAAEPEALTPFAADKGYFDVAFEASGSSAALIAALQCVRPRGTIVQVGLGGGDTTAPFAPLVGKEIRLCGTFRFQDEFPWAVDYLGSGRIDPRPLLTEVRPVGDALAAFDLAADRGKAMKVMLAF